MDTEIDWTRPIVIETRIGAFPAESMLIHGQRVAWRTDLKDEHLPLLSLVAPDGRIVNVRHDIDNAGRVRNVES